MTETTGYIAKMKATSHNKQKACELLHDRNVNYSLSKDSHGHSVFIIPKAELTKLPYDDESKEYYIPTSDTPQIGLSLQEISEKNILKTFK
jgi:hypothetical protein